MNCALGLIFPADIDDWLANGVAREANDMTKHFVGMKQAAIFEDNGAIEEFIRGSAGAHAGVQLLLEDVVGDLMVRQYSVGLYRRR